MEVPMWSLRVRGNVALGSGIDALPVEPRGSGLEPEPKVANTLFSVSADLIHSFHYHEAANGVETGTWLRICDSHPYRLTARHPSRRASSAMADFFAEGTVAQNSTPIVPFQEPRSIGQFRQNLKGACVLV